MAEPPAIKIVDDGLVRWTGYAMNSLASDAFIRRAEADEVIATATHATPSRQESVRVVAVGTGILLVMVVGHFLGLSDGIVYAALGAMGGIYAVPKAIEKWRGPPPAPKPPEP